MAFEIAQFVFDTKLNSSSQGAYNKIKARLVNFLFNYYKRLDLLVEAQIGLSRLYLPFSHQLPFILKSTPHYSTNLTRIAELVCLKYPNMAFIDIGANIGDSVALLRTKTAFPILCVEGDNYFFEILQKNCKQFNDVYVANEYVGESNIQLNAVSVGIGGTAHLTQTIGLQNVIQTKTLSALLENYPLFSHSKMLKIDTDGFDNKILRGSVDFLKVAKPVIFFEYDPFFLSQQHDDGLSIFNILSQVGYANLLIYENNGELLVSADVDNTRLLEDINHYYTGRNSIRYCDICAFHEEDVDLFERIRENEIQFFINSRNTNMV